VDSSTAGGIHGLYHENEDIRVLVYDQEEAFEMVRSGVINNALGIIALQWLELNWKKLSV
jgi:ADP-ribose pyrophosphatase